MTLLLVATYLAGIVSACKCPRLGLVASLIQHLSAAGFIVLS